LVQFWVTDYLLVTVNVLVDVWKGYVSIYN
jgi:hypothetical protein